MRLTWRDTRATRRGWRLRWIGAALAAVGALAGGATTSVTAAAAADAPLICAPVGITLPPALVSRPGRIVTASVHGHAVLVYLPGANDVLPSLRLPVLYLLHGAPGRAQDWITQGRTPALLDALITSGQLPPLIAVLPDEQGVAPGDSWWGNTALGDTVETWLTADLIPTIDSRYCTLGARYRGIAGLSAGGFGAVNLALRELGLFSWAAGYSGVYTAPADIFGTGSAANSPQLTASRVPAAQRFPLYLGGGASDTVFLGETLRFTATVQALHWAPLRTEVVPGAHTWEAWAVEARDSLVWLGRLWGSGPGVQGV
jgi:enterochelin esterase-like enzyme